MDIKIAKLILQIYADYSKRFGTYKITYILQHYYGIYISVGRVSDNFTYIRVVNKWHYLCIVVDWFSHKIIAWNISSKFDIDLVMTAFKKAYEKRNHPEGLIFHSDQGAQYTAFSFRQLLDSLNVVQSFSKKDYPFDNDCCECFFKYLKKEETNRKTYHSL